jgi:Uma2 family endonuclease
MPTLAKSPPAAPSAPFPAPPAAEPPAPVYGREDRRFLLNGIDWPTYVAIRDALGDRPVRVTFDGSALEFLMPGPDHERFKEIIRDLILELGDALDIDIEPGGSLTLRDPKVERGLEADTWFWIAQAADVAGKFDIDLKRNPPDLAIEIDISRSALDRMDIYARLGIPEVWTADGRQLTVHRLRRGKNPGYRPAKASPSFPGFPVQRLAEFLTPGRAAARRKLLSGFREWVRGIRSGG